MTEGAVTIRLSRLLAQMMGGERSFAAQGGTVGEALRDLARNEPALAMHLFDDAGAIRRHILVIHNDVYQRGRDALTRPLEPGDRLFIVNTVTGG